MGFIPSAPLPLIRLLLFFVGLTLQQLSFFDMGCLWDRPWIIGYLLSIGFMEMETESTPMILMGSEISSSSMEGMPNGIGSELEGRSFNYHTTTIPLRDLISITFLKKVEKIIREARFTEGWEMVRPVHQVLPLQGPIIVKRRV